MATHKLTSPQLLLLESLATTPMTIADLANETRFSSSYVRAQLKILEATGRLEKVDSRMPFMYRVPLNSPFLAHRDRISKYREILGQGKESDNSFVKLIRKAPKADWPALAEELRAIVDTIEVLEADGRLVDTLEGAL